MWLVQCNSRTTVPRPHARAVFCPTPPIVISFIFSCCKNISAVCNMRSCCRICQTIIIDQSFIILCVNNIKIVIFLVIIEDVLFILQGIGYKRHFFPFLPFIHLLFPETVLNIFMPILAYFAFLWPLFTLVIPTLVGTMTELLTDVTPSLAKVMTLIGCVIRLFAQFE